MLMRELYAVKVEEVLLMKHVRRVTVAKAATTNDHESVSQVLDSIFAFVLDVIDVKGKSHTGS
jgi:hypothetical protein